jgi:hypothetical protein
MKTARIWVASLLLTGFGLICLFLAAVADDRWTKIELATDMRLRSIAALDRRVVTPAGAPRWRTWWRLIKLHAGTEQADRAGAGRPRRRGAAYLNEQAKPLPPRVDWA